MLSVRVCVDASKKYLGPADAATAIAALNDTMLLANRIRVAANERDASLGALKALAPPSVFVSKLGPPCCPCASALTRSLGNGSVNFESPVDAATAIAALNDTMLLANRIRVVANERDASRGVSKPFAPNASVFVSNLDPQVTEQTRLFFANRPCIVFARLCRH